MSNFIGEITYNVSFKNLIVPVGFEMTTNI